MELLAPAGTYDCLVTAVNCGADAVYFAGKAFGARSFAGNFSDEEIFRAAEFCHLRNARAYVTVNTLVFDREFAELESFVKTITKAGIDGVIVQDLGVLRLIREISPDVELHASTQMTVHSADGVTELERLGVSRVVLSRELSGEEMSCIIKSTSAEAEVFVHGAMCMSYSGQCLMSSIIGGRSGNRGKCAQPCRLAFSADGSESKYYLSLKDMSLAEHIARLSEIGVASLKIEGRMKGEAYVAAVVSAYRKLIDENRKPTKNEIEGLNRIFFRGGLTDGYFTGKCDTHMFAFDKPDNPYLKNIKEEAIVVEKKLPVSIYAKIYEGDYPEIKLTCGEYTSKVIGTERLQTAANRPATAESVAKQFEKTGGTVFEAKSSKVEIKGSPFVPVSLMNEVRRNAIEKLEAKILEPYKNKRISGFNKLDKIKNKNDVGYTCSVLNMEQYRMVRSYDFKRISLPIHIVYENSEELIAHKDKVAISLPVIMRNKQRDNIKEKLMYLKNLGFNKVEISTIDAISMADGFELFGTQRLNITNSIAEDEYKRLGFSGVCLSAELNLGQARDVSKTVETELVAYGRIPVMTTENCILKNMGKCPCDGKGEITDRTGARFPIVRDGDFCRSVVLNSVPLYLGDKREDLATLGVDLKLIFTIEDDIETKKICEDYLHGKVCGAMKFTRLHYYKGALD